MGMGYNAKCTECGYEFGVLLGCGFTYPSVYSENIEKMKKGELGKEAKEFFEKYPGGVINSENAVSKCTVCGNYDEVYDLTMYKPKKGLDLPENVDFIMVNEMKGKYIKHMSYPHKCSKCGSDSKIYNKFEKDLMNGLLKCPKCSGDMMDDPWDILWD